MKVKRLLALFTAAMLLFAIGCENGNTISNEQNSTDTPLTEKFKGQTLKLYMYEPDAYISKDYSYLFEFEEKYGVTIDLQYSYYDDAVKSIATAIASDTPFDMFYCPDTFPSVINILQPIENTGINLNDSIWNKALLRASTINGKAYLIDSINNKESDFSVCYYDKSLFDDKCITSPIEYFEKGEWTWENFLNCIKSIKSLGKNYVGAAVHKSGAMLLSGNSFYSYNPTSNRYYVSANTEIRQAMCFLAELNEQKLIQTLDTINAKQTVGMVLSTTCDIRGCSIYSDCDPQNIRAVLLPKKDAQSEHIVTAPIEGFGLVARAKNTELAGLFLYEAIGQKSHTKSHLFYNDFLEDFFFDTYKEYSDKIIYFTDQGLLNAAKLDYDFYYKWNEVSADKIEEYIDSQLENMNNVIIKSEEYSKQLKYSING